MTRKEKDDKMIRLVKRLTRLTCLSAYHAEKYGALVDIPTALAFGFHNVNIAIAMNTLASTPTEDMIHQNPKFPNGGISHK